MNSAFPAQVTQSPQAEVLEAAFQALKTYAAGSSRGLLMPIDEAVAASLKDPTARVRLERRLVSALQSGGSVAARDYICAKLTVMGTEGSASVLAEVSSDVQTNTAARNALEAIPDQAAAKHLRESLPKLPALQKVGAINSLGVRRDQQSVKALLRLLRDPNLVIVSAAVAALGRIGTPTSGQALRAFRKRAPRQVIPALDDATLVCADYLLETGHRREATQLYQTLTALDRPSHVRESAHRGIQKATG